MEFRVLTYRILKVVHLMYTLLNIIDIKIDRIYDRLLRSFDVIVHY